MKRALWIIIFISVLTSPTVYALVTCQAIYSSQTNSQAIDPALTQQLAGTDLKDDFWPDLSKTLMGKGGIRKMKAYFNTLAAGAPDASPDVFYRGMALSLQDLQFIKNEGLKAEKSTNSQKEIFVSTEMGDSIFYALSRTNSSPMPLSSSFPQKPALLNHLPTRGISKPKPICPANLLKRFMFLIPQTWGVLFHSEKSSSQRLGANSPSNRKTFLKSGVCKKSMSVF